MRVLCHLSFTPARAAVLAVLSVVVMAVLTIALPARHASGCSTFCLRHDGATFFGKNYDWMVGDGLLVVNKRNVAKEGLTAANGVPASWVSRYGSVTFNQYGRELPSGGINEAGVVIELMWLEETEYPPVDARPTLGNLQWIQYQLDLHASLEEVIASDAAVRIAPGGASKVHFLVCDREGNAGTIEFLGGELRYHAGESLPVPALTNHSYARSLRYLSGRRSAGEGEPPVGNGSLERFARVAARLEAYDGSTPALDYAFDTLADAAQGDATQWSIVYDIANLAVHFRTHEVSQRKSLRLAALDFACDTPVRVLDLNSDRAGDITEVLDEYTVEVNREVIGKSFGKTPFLKGVPSESLDGLAGYPSRLPCEGRRSVDEGVDAHEGSHGGAASSVRP